MNLTQGKCPLLCLKKQGSMQSEWSLALTLLSASRLTCEAHLNSFFITGKLLKTGSSAAESKLTNQTCASF